MNLAVREPYIFVKNEPCFKAADCINEVFSKQELTDVPIGSVLNKMFAEAYGLSDDYKVNCAWRIPLRMKRLFLDFVQDHANQKHAK